MTHILTAPPTDRSMWRRLFKRCHPDHGGEHDLFVWLQGLHEHVAGDALEPPQRRYEQPRRTTNADSPRIDYTAAHTAASFDALTLRALDLAATLPEPYSGILAALSDCYELGAAAGPTYRQQWTGATYKSLAAIGHRVGLTGAERGRWYRIAESVPLSQRHAGHILARLEDRAA